MSTCQSWLGSPPWVTQLELDARFSMPSVSKDNISRFPSHTHAYLVKKVTRVSHVLYLMFRLKMISEEELFCNEIYE